MGLLVNWEQLYSIFGTAQLVTYRVTHLRASCWDVFYFEISLSIMSSVGNALENLGIFFIVDEKVIDWDYCTTCD